MNKILKEIQASSISEIAISDTGISQRYKFTPDFLGFQGHFEGHAVLPAVVQLMICQEMVAKQISPGIKLSNVSRAKFITVIEANDDIDVSCKISVNTDSQYKCSCTLTVGDEIASKFNLTFS